MTVSNITMTCPIVCACCWRRSSASRSVAKAAGDLRGGIPDAHKEILRERPDLRERPKQPVISEAGLPNRACAAASKQHGIATHLMKTSPCDGYLPSYKPDKASYAFAALGNEPHYHRPMCLLIFLPTNYVAPSKTKSGLQFNIQGW